MAAFEVNFDGLVGPTHNYAGLAAGNVASARSAGRMANPREAALQGLDKMRTLYRLGIPQGVLPPQPRPDVELLRRLGFSGDPGTVLRTAAERAPRLLSAACSGAAMWAANAATVSPSADTADGRVHFTPANLASSLHRAIEAPVTERLLRAIFPDPARFAHHRPLPGVPQLGDEGAANHTRLCADYGSPGLELFVFGRSAFADAPTPVRYPARQTREAAEAVARLHGLDAARTLFAQQNPVAIDAGVFHNDVIAVGNLDTLLYHEQAFLEPAAVRAAIRGAAAFEPRFLEVPAARVSLVEAVETYLFNSQLVCSPGGMTLVVPVECREHAGVWGYLETLAAGGDPIRRIEVLDVRQSMRNGGGPACLRLRVVLTETEWAAVAAGVRFDDALHDRLVTWVQRHYRDRLEPADLADPALIEESRIALDELTALLGLGSVYEFQQP